MKVVVHSASQVVTVQGDPAAALAGRTLQGAVRVFSDPGGVALAVDDDGLISDIGRNEDVLEKYKNCNVEKVINASGMCILPGFVDAHTHPIWSGDRVHEFAMKLEGKSYMEIHEAGGGIFFTVDHTNNASDDELYGALEERLLKMLKAGTTLVECKSGYGLEKEKEIRLLKILEKAKQRLPVEISITYCGAHAVPRGKTSDEAVDSIVREHIPEIKTLMNKNELSVENIDVFCDKGVFDVEQTRKILEAGKSIGLRINFHGDELFPMKSAEMGAEIGASAISHLEEISEEGMKMMADKGVVAVLLPTTVHALRLHPPPTRKMIALNVPIALGTDFNPNAFCYSMPMVMNLSCIYLGMSMAESLIAATFNAAASLGRSSTHGSIQVGKYADLVIVNAPRWEHIIYQFGCHSDIIKYVIKKGNIVSVAEL